MKILEYLICRSKTWGPTKRLHPKLGGATTLDSRLNCQVYVCKNYAEFQVMNRDIVGRTNRDCWCAVQVRDTETGEVSDPPDVLDVPEATQKPISPASAMVGAATEKPAGEVVSRPSQPTPAGLPVETKLDTKLDTLPPLPEAPKPEARKKSEPAKKRPGRPPKAK